ncbi:MAG: carbohydrate kinase family protein [Eubacteriales bacterium]|nr:carbohydrate kinase family protein [Eubacteriales bacterium]
MKNGIVVVGNVFVDIKGFPDAKYIPAGRNAGRVEFFHGGVGRNIAEDIANLELRPTFVTTTDESAQGEDVVQKLRRHKVNTDYMVPAKDGMGMWLAVFDETGDVVGSISKRPDMTALKELIDSRGDEIFSACDSIVIEIDLDKDVVKSVFRFAQKYRKRVFAAVANMSIASDRRDFIKEVECFVCNLQEAEILFVDDFANLPVEELGARISQDVLSAGIRSMVVTLGSKGCIYADMSGDYGYCPALKIQARDTTGAGDAFCAGLAAGLTYGCSLAQAAEIGTKIAASVVTSSDNVCPRFLPEELGINAEVGISDFYGSEDILK